MYAPNILYILGAQMSIIVNVEFFIAVLCILTYSVPFKVGWFGKNNVFLCTKIQKRTIDPFRERRSVFCILFFKNAYFENNYLQFGVKIGLV